MSAPIKIFCCYAREDEKLLEQLVKHLSPLQQQGQITIWSDTNITAGAEWEKELHQHLESANIILLLISPDFMNSNYCYSTEMSRAIELHNQGNAHVIPVLLRSTFWRKAPFAKLQVLPSNAKPVNDKGWSDTDEAFNNITEGIYHIVSELHSRYLPHGANVPPQVGAKEGWLIIGKEHFTAKRFIEALEAYEQAMHLAPDDTTVSMNKGRTLNSLQRYEEALAVCEQAIRLDPNFAPAYVTKSITLGNLQCHEEALTACGQAIRLDPHLAPAYVARSMALSNLHRHEEALAVCEQAIHLDPNFAPIYIIKGIALSNLRHFQESLVACEQAIHLDPTDADSYRTKGNALNSLHRHEEALVAYEQAIHLDPHLASVYYNKGIVLSNLHRHEEALAACEQAIHLDPHLVLAYITKSIILKYLGRQREAKEVYEKGRQLGFDS